MKKSELRNIIREVLREGFLSDRDKNTLNTQKGYVKDWKGNYWEILRIYPGQRNPITIDWGRNGAHAMSYNELSPTTEKHNGKLVWKWDT